MKRRIAMTLLIFSIAISIVDVGALLNKPLLVSPIQGATGVGCTPTLQWNQAIGATSYDVQVSKWSSFTATVVNTTVTGTSYTVSTSLQGSTRYYWRVRAKSFEDVSTWATSYFTTASSCAGGDLTVPNLISPTNNTTWTQSLYPAFHWQAVTSASEYTIQISRSSTDFTSTYLVKEATVFSTNYYSDTAFTNCTSYYWRVRAESDGTVGSWSDVWKFTMQVPPSQPALNYPLSGAVLTVRRPEFSWESSSGATAYTIEIDGSTYSVSTTTFTPYSNLSQGSHNWRVRATSCGGGQTSDWSLSRSFTIDLNDVVLKTPENGSLVTTATPTFEWYPVDGATKYKLEVRRDTIGGQKLFEVEVTGTSFTPTAILNAGTYAWQVTSYRNGGWTGSWSSHPFTFTVQTGEGLAAPALTSPISGSTVDVPFTLQWESVDGAYSYTLEYSRDEDFQDATSVTLFATDYIFYSELEEGRWYWHVRANTSQGEAGPWSTAWSFEVGLPVPQLLSPVNGASQGTSAVNFDWSDVTGSQIGGELYDLDYYVLQYSTSSAFESQNTISINEVGGYPLRDSRYGPINLGDGTYYWRVKAVYIKYPESTLREGFWSTSFTFSISTGGVNIPSLVSPISGSVMKGTSVTLVWTSVESSGITGYVLVYMMSTTTNPGNPSQWTQGSYTEVIIPGQSTSSYTITLQENTSQKPFYWWSIATVGSSGQKGIFPSPVNFSIDNTPPDISSVELVQPVNTTLETRIPTFTWRIPLDNYQDAASWTLEFASDIQLQQNRTTVPDLTNLSTIISGDNASISYTLTSSQALTNGTWYWHVCATDAAGNKSAFTSVVSFVVNAGEEPPAKAQLVSPPNGFEDTPSRPTFSWLQVQGATTFHLQVDNTSDFASPVIDEDGIVTTSHMASSDLEPSTYYWRVTSNAPNAEWSDVWSFTISGEAPNQVILTTPTSGAQDTGSTPLFQWQALEGASTYTLEVSSNISFTDLKVNKTGLTTTSWGASSDWESNDPSQLNDGTYYWRVTSNLADSMSAIWNFTVKTSEPSSITLTVITSNLNGDPVSAATVTLTEDGSSAGTATTDASGRAVISNLQSGTYTLEISATGYRVYTETVSVSADTTKNVTLYRGAVIHGYVYYDNTQNPAANVAVRVYENETQLQVVSDITDTNGYFIVDNIADNKTYYIIVESYEDQKKQGIIPVDAPTTANALTIIVKTEGEIIGVVQDEDGASLPGAKITLRDAQGQFVNSTSTSNMGSFTFKVTPGQYYVEITLTGYEEYQGDIFTVEYKEIQDLGLITLYSRTGTLVVTVQSEGGELLDVAVTVRDEAGNIIDTISAIGGTASVEIPVGVYSLEADAEGFEPQIATGISIESGTTVSQDFILTAASGSVRMYVTDVEGLPISEAQVTLDDESAGTTDETGTLVISDVSPGDHTISVIKEGFADYKEIQTVNPEETLIMELIMEETGIPLTYVVIIAVVVAAAGGFFFLRRGPKPTKEKPLKRREKTRAPTGVRKEGLPRKSYRGR
jgi:hypothetical protein